MEKRIEEMQNKIKFLENFGVDVVRLKEILDNVLRNYLDDKIDIAQEDLKKIENFMKLLKFDIEEKIKKMPNDNPEDIFDSYKKMQEDILKKVKKIIDEEKMNIKTQLYNTLRYDLLQYLEHKKVL